MNAIPQDPDRLATKDDLTVLGAGLRAEMAELRTEMAELRTELSTELAELRTEMRTGFADLRGETKQVASEMMRTLMVSMVASNATLVGLVLAAVKLA